MKIRLQNLWEGITTTYWFIPTLMTLIAIGASSGLTTLDTTTSYKTSKIFFWIYSGGVDGARSLLSTIAASMITVAGVSFSIIIVALTLASSQFGPRLLGNFMKDKGNQVVLGTFISTFIYCIMVLSSIDDVTDKNQLPNLSITFGIILSLASIGVFIFFVHHASSSIQAENVIARVYFELEEAVERLYPEELGKEKEGFKDKTEKKDAEDYRKNSAQILSTRTGYIQAVENESILKIAEQNDLVIQLKHRPGDFIVIGNMMATAWPREKINDEIEKRINDTFILGKKRTLQQDAEFAILQLVEIAVRSLSPGINDPFTAISCIDRLGAALSQISERKFPSPYRYDDEDNLRVIADITSFEGLTDSAFLQIRQYGKISVAVTVRLLETLGIIAHNTKTDEQKQALRKHAVLISNESKNFIKANRDQEDIQERFKQVIQILES